MNTVTIVGYPNVALSKPKGKGSFSVLLTKYTTSLGCTSIT